MAKISVQQFLEVVAGFDEQGGASLGLVAWELCVDEHEVQSAWEHAITEGWLKPAGHDPAADELLYRFTHAGWAAVLESSSGLKPGPEAADESA